MLNFQSNINGQKCQSNHFVFRFLLVLSHISVEFSIIILIIRINYSLLINIIKMIQFDLELQINELLTLFMQSFKNIFAAKLSLIESISLNSNSLQSNPQFLLSKLSTKIFRFEWSIDPYSLPVTHQMISNIQRFYLRIQEYLQFRLSTLSNLQDKAINKEIDVFHKFLHKIISSIQNPNTLSATVGDFLYQISKCEKTFTSKLIDLISNKNSITIRAPIDFQSLNDIRSFIQSKICKEQFEMFREPPKASLPPSREKKLSLRGRDEQHSKVKYLMMRKKISSKIEAVRQSLPPRQAVKSYKENSQQHGIWDSKNLTPEDQTIELQSYVEKQNTIRFNKAYDILQIQTARPILTREQIFAELEGKNVKNKTHIDGFIHKYEKKHRRSLRRQRSQKQSKSSVKSSKLPSKGDDRGIFSMRLQNSQHQYPSSFKNENLKKYEQFQLPLILSRNNRRTTVQK